jgi:hypothetical protein
VHRGRGQVEPLGDLAQAQPVVALEHREDPQRPVHGLDHAASIGSAIGSDICGLGLVPVETQA